ncbi:MAG TPA: phosphate ABC transporter permease PstA [Ilumatobacteraceae bacterium]|nr:phosphate ABC transporter permease PstA [Ilumatobacteraceae bacterium]
MALATPALGGATAREVVAARLTRRDRDVAGWLMLGTLFLTVGFTLLVLFTLLFEVTSDAWPMLSERPVDFVTDTIGSDPMASGLWPGVYGSFFIGLGVIVLAFPIGIGAAIYLEEYARDGFLTRLIMVSMRNLAGVPAVIYGVLGFIIFRGWLEFLTGGSSVVAAAFTMAVLVLPIVIITSMEAIRAVPQGLRDAGYGVGASRWEVTRDHTLAYAAPGILTGTVLSLARALGEAAPLLILGAITGLLPETSLTGKFTAIPMLIYNWSGRPDTPGAEIGWTSAAAAAGVMLLTLVLFFNAAAIVLRNRFERRRIGT